MKAWSLEGTDARKDPTAARSLILERERLPMRTFGRGLRLLAALLLVWTVPLLASRLADWLAPTLTSVDPKNVFAWSWIHHLAQCAITLGIMGLWSGDSLRRWGFNLNHLRVSLQWFGWFAVCCTIGTLAAGILPMLLLHSLPVPEFDLNARNLAGRLGFDYLLSGPGEEPLFRGLVMVILLKSWRRGIGSGTVRMPVAGLWATLLFMLAHVRFTVFPFSLTHFSILQQLFCLGYGLFYAALFYRTGSLLGPILAHGVSNGIPPTLIYLTLILTHAPGAATSVPGEVMLRPHPPIAGREVTILYRAAPGPLAGATQVSLHHGINGWQQVADTPMHCVDTDRWTAIVALPGTAHQLDFVFTDGTRWDNHRGDDWHESVVGAKGDAPLP